MLCGCDTWSLTLREEQGFKTFEKRVLRNTFGAKRGEECQEDEQNYVLRNCVSCALQKISLYCIVGRPERKKQILKWILKKTV